MVESGKINYSVWYSTWLSSAHRQVHVCNKIIVWFIVRGLMWKIIQIRMGETLGIIHPAN